MNELKAQIHAMRMRKQMPLLHFFVGGFFFAVLAAFLKSCALGASLLLGLRGFLPAARRLRMLAYRPSPPLLGITRSQDY